MKLILTTSEAYIWKPQLVENLQKNLPAEIKIDSVFITNFKSGKVKLNIHLKRYYYLLGFKQFFLHGIDIIKFKIMDFLDRYFHFKNSYSIQMACKKLKLNYFVVKNLNDERVLDKIRRRSPDLIINFGNQIFGEKLLSLPKRGCINKHCSLLPSYKGIYPIWWTLLNNEKECGVSLHQMEKAVDAGKILGQEIIQIEPDDSFYSIFQKCYNISVDLIIKTVQQIANNNEKEVINSYKPSYFGFPTKKEMKLFFQSGKKIK